MICRSRWSMMLCAIVFILFVGFIPVTGADTPIDLIAKADFAYMTRHIEEDMTQAIALYEAVLPELDSLSAGNQAYLLNRLSQLYYEATMFSEGDTSEDGTFLERGKAYGLQSLRLNPQFAETENDNFGEAVSYVTDAGALHWTASNWGKLCGMNPIVGLMQQGGVLALFSRCVEVDPEYWGGSASSSLGSLLIMSPSTLGGDKEEGLALVEGSITLDLSYLSNRVVLAEYWGFTYNFLGQLTGIRDAELIKQQLAIVLDADIGDWPFWNPQAKELAEKLLAQLQEMLE
jgi:TRAP transporter TatT component family protein